jgi:hypothetical protein
MGRTITIRFVNGEPVSGAKDPRRQREALAVGKVFIDNPGAVIVAPNPELPDEAQAAARALLRRHTR